MNVIMNPYIPSIEFGLPPYHIDFGALGPIMISSQCISAFYIVLQWVSVGGA